MSLEAVVDTNTVASLLRAPRRVQRGAVPRLETSLDEHIRKKRLIVAIDDDGGLAGEWEQTCGREAVAVLLTHWEGLSGIFRKAPARGLPRNVSRTLRQLGFRDAIDKLIVRLAFVLTDGIIVSSDPDFWNPGVIGDRGRANAPVARLLREELEIEVLLLSALIARLTQARG